MKDLIDFERELEKEFPFKEVIISDAIFKEMLFNEFTKTDNMPNWDLFIGKYYTKEELKKGSDEINKYVPISSSNESHAANMVEFTTLEVNIKKKGSEFGLLEYSKSLPSDCYSHTIEGTKMVKILIEIKKQIDLLSLFFGNPVNYNLPESDCAIKAKSTFNNIILELEKLESLKLRKKVIYGVFNNNDLKTAEIYDYCNKTEKKATEVYLILKGYLNSNLKDYLETIKSEEEKNTTEQKGFKLGYTKEQLENLFEALKNDGFLPQNTDKSHFANAFNGELLSNDFKPLKWIEPTAGAICFFHLTAKKPKWKAIEHLFEPANYAKLLSQSKQNGTFELIIKRLQSIL